MSSMSNMSSCSLLCHRAIDTIGTANLGRLIEAHAVRIGVNQMSTLLCHMAVPMLSDSDNPGPNHSRFDYFCPLLFSPLGIRARNNNTRVTLAISSLQSQFQFQFKQQLNLTPTSPSPSPYPSPCPCPCPCPCPSLATWVPQVQWIE